MEAQDRAQHEPETGAWRFANAEFDPRTHELRVDGRVVAVEAKPLQVLTCLLQRPAETLTKDELLSAVWPGRIVTEGTLTKAVMKLRAVLGDDAQIIIRTVHGFGYRLGVPAERQAGGSLPAFELVAGQTVPFRANWRLVQALDPEQRRLVWLARHHKTGDHRVFKFATDSDTLVRLKREITLFRVLREALGETAPVVQILDWNFEEPPYYTESEWLEGGDLGAWMTTEIPSQTRLEIMARLCDAVAAAHEVGVLHKDLKPGNVLLRPVPGQIPEVRLVDFGIGMLADGHALEALAITRLGFTGTRGADGSTSGTPLYLAPEIIAGHAPTQRSDIYALGVMLFQMLAGDPRRQLAPGWERDIDDALLREDIAAAADVDPERRLGDAGELARRVRSLDRRRSEQTQAARQQAETARLRANAQSARRRRNLALGLAAVMALAALVSTVFHLQARHAQAETARALQDLRREMTIREAVNRFLNDDLLAAGNPFAGSHHDLPVSQLIERALPGVADRFPDQPEIAGELLATMGRSLTGLARFDSAREVLDQAVEQLRQAHGDDDGRVVEARLARAKVEGASNQGAEFAQQMDALVAGLASQRVESALERKILIAHAWSASMRGDFATALSRFDAAPRSGADVTNGDDADDLADWHRGRGLALHRLARHEEALVDAQAAYALRQASAGNDDPVTWIASSEIANIEIALARFDTAIDRLVDVHHRLGERFGIVHHETSLAAHQLGLALLNAGQPERAVEPLQEAVRSRQTLLGVESGAAMTSAGVLVPALLLVDRLDEADAVLASYVGYQPQTDYDRRAWSAMLRHRAELRLRQHRPEAARVDCEQSLRLISALTAEGHPMRRSSEVCLGISLAHLGQRDSARALLDPHLEPLRQAATPASELLVRRIEAVLPLLEP